MRRLRILYFLVCLLLSPVTIVNLAKAQMPRRGGNQVAIMGWTDDSHYQIRNFDSNKNLVIQSVDIKTGKAVVLPPSKSEREVLSQALPAGITLSNTDVISPDKKSAVIIKDNDLFFFTTGDKELKRLTNDKPPEINTRFSPDGNKLAYLRTDETDVPLFTLNRLDKPDGIHGLIEATPYPKPGDPNPKVKMGIADIATEKTTWVKTNYSVDQYIAWPFWTPDSKKLASTLAFAKNYKGKLYLTHGDMDDNVHIQNSIYLISRLEDEGKVFQFMLYPEGRHGWAGAKATHSRNEANNFWLKNFFGK